MYIGYALIFLVVAGFEALLMRIQLAIPNNTFVSPQVFNRLFTMHGTTMVFFVGMPILFGFGNYLIPSDDRRARYGVSTPERLQLLDIGVRRLASLLQLSRRRWSIRSRHRARCWLVRLCAAYFSSLLARPQHGLLDTRPAAERHRLRRHRAQYRGNDHLHALPWHEAEPHALAGLALPGHCFDGLHCH